MILCWEVLWKLMAMWRAARKRQPVWFVLLAVLNTGGILPILYLIFTRRED